MSQQTEQIVLDIEPRTQTGKNACRRLRTQGLIPGNLYGLEAEPLMIAVSPRALELIMRRGSGLNTIVTLSLAGQTRRRPVIIKALQRDPVSDKPVHVDFLRLDLSKPIQVRVPVRLVGLATGVKNEGGLVDFVHREIEVECLATDIPSHIDVDVSPLHINQHLSISDLTFPSGVKVLDEPSQIIVGVAPPMKEEEVAPAAAAPVAETPVEPEIVKKGGKVAEGEKGEKGEKGGGPAS